MKKDETGAAQERLTDLVQLWDETQDPRKGDVVLDAIHQMREDRMRKIMGIEVSDE